MSEIPDDIMQAAWEAWGHARMMSISADQVGIVARAILAERERCANADKAATTVYGNLLWRHMDAARKNFDGPERKKMYELIEAFREQYPAECQVWDERYSEPTASSSAG